MRDVIEIRVKDFELRPNLKYIAKRMMEEKADCYVDDKQDATTLYKLFQRRGIKIWTQRIGESQWAIRIKEKGEEKNPLDELGRAYETNYGKLKERIMLFEENKKIKVADKQEAHYILQKYREYFPSRKTAYKLKEEKGMLILSLETK